MKSRVYIDTNVLISDFFFRNGTYRQGETSTKALQFLFSKPQKADLFVASFSIAQFISSLANRKIGLSMIITEISRIMQKFTVVDFREEDIKQSVSNIVDLHQTKDLEDQLQFDLSRKMKCNYIMTNNYKDFKDFADISVLQPRKYRAIEFLRN